MVSNIFQGSANCDDSIKRLINNLGHRVLPHFQKTGLLQGQVLDRPLMASTRDEQAVLITMNIDANLNVTLETRDRNLKIKYKMDKETGQYGYVAESRSSAFYGPDFLMAVDALNEKIEKQDAMGKPSLRFSVPYGHGIIEKPSKVFKKGAKANVPSAKDVNNLDHQGSSVHLD